MTMGRWAGQEQGKEVVSSRRRPWSLQDKAQYFSIKECMNAARAAYNAPG